MMYRFFGKPKPLIRINLAEKIQELGLDTIYGSESWPEPAAVRELGTKVKNLTGEGFKNPFVCADLRK